MFFSVISVALLAVSSASALPIRRTTVPSTYNAAVLEPYDVYHTRYMALGCENQHGEAFFDQCCHPMLSTETLAANRPAQCVPGSPAFTSAMNAEEDCTDEPSSTPVPVSTSTPPPPPPSTTPKPSTSHTSTTPKPSSTSSGNDLTDLITGGIATFFYQNGVAGACGTVHPDSAFIAAMDQDRYGNSGEKSALCGKQVLITNQKNGKTVTVTVADDCPTCKNKNSIDLSVAAFKQIGTEAEGELDIAWKFL